MAIRVIPDYQWSTAISTWAINYIAGIHSLNILPVPVYCLRHIVHHEVFKTDLNPSTAPYSISLCAGSVINATFHYVMSTMALFHRQKALLSKQLAFLISTLIYREMTKGVQMWTVFPPFCVDVLIIGRELNMSSTDIVFRQNQLKIVPFPLTWWTAFSSVSGRPSLSESIRPCFGAGWRTGQTRPDEIRTISSLNANPPAILISDGACVSANCTIIIQ